MLNEAIIRLDLLNCMLNEGNIKSLATIIQEEFFKSVNKNSYNDLSQDEKEKLSNYIKTRSEEIKKLVSEISSDTNEQAFVYDILMNHEQTFPEDFNDVKTTIQEFSKIKRSENFKSEKDINKYKSFSDLHKAVYDFKQEFNKREFAVSFNIGEKILSFDSFNIYKLKNKDFSEFSKFIKDNNIAWCIKSRSHWNEYKAPYYYIEKSNKPFALLHYGSKQFKDVHDKELKQTDELIKLLGKVCEKTNEMYEPWKEKIYLCQYPNATPIEMFLATNKGSSVNNGIINAFDDVRITNDYVKDGKLLIKFGKISGHFDCSDNQLTSLEGAPSEINGWFYCNNNQLTSLEGAPSKGVMGFECNNNKLTSLKGAPSKVLMSFECSNNQLTSLRGAPSRLGGSFDCSNNQLTSLEGAPSRVDWGFVCSNNRLTSLRGAPLKVGMIFNCSNNQLTSLEGAPSRVGGNFDCSNNNSKFTEDQVTAVSKVSEKIIV